MNGEVERLQELLTRVQTNRGKPRASAVAAAVAAEPVRPAPASVPAPEKPLERAPAPRQAAVEAPVARPRVASAPAAVERVAPSRASAPETGPQRVEPADVTQPVTSVAKVVSPHPDAAPMTFGELVHRSLSLKPR